MDSASLLFTIIVAVHALSHILWVSSPILRSCESHKIHQDVLLNIYCKHGENCHVMPFLVGEVSNQTLVITYEDHIPDQ